MALVRRCGSCGGASRSSTARTGSTGRVPRVAEAVPLRYKVGDKTFGTLAAAQDYARRKGLPVKTM